LLAGEQAVIGNIAMHARKRIMLLMVLDG